MNILGICGSLRKGSFNRKLLREAVAVLAPDSFAEADLRLPLYDGDLEAAEGIPPEVQALADAIRAADGIIIASPEYNKAYSGVLKNALDWVSRVKGNPWEDKPVAIVSAAAGREGGARGQFALRLALAPFRVRIVPGPEVLVAQAAEQFDEEGRLVPESYRKALEGLMTALRREIARSAAG